MRPEAAPSGTGNACLLCQAVPAETVLTLPTMLPPMSHADCIFGCVAATWAVMMSVLRLAAGVGLAGVDTPQQINVDLGSEEGSSPCSPHTDFPSS